MRDEFFWTVVVLVWVFGWVTIWYLRKRAVESRAMKLRELLHSERMAAITNGVPLPEIPTEDEAIPGWVQPEAERLCAPSGCDGWRWSSGSSRSSPASGCARVSTGPPTATFTSCGAWA